VQNKAKLLNHSLDYVPCLCHQFEIIGFSLFMGLVFNNNLVRAFIQWPIINTNRENQLSKFSLQLPKNKVFFHSPTRHHTTAVTFNASSSEQIEAKRKLKKKRT
jgi:hypothetical protein